MGTISGKDGNLTIDGVQICPVTNIKLTRTSDNPDYAANDTGGKKARVAGIKDVTGSFRINDTDAPVVEGDSVTMLIHDGSNDYTEEVIIDEIDEEIDIDTGAIVGWDVTFSGTVITPVCSSS